MHFKMREKTEQSERLKENLAVNIGFQFFMYLCIYANAWMYGTGGTYRLITIFLKPFKNFPVFGIFLGPFLQIFMEILYALCPFFILGMIVFTVLVATWFVIDDILIIEESSKVR